MAICAGPGFNGLALKVIRNLGKKKQRKLFQVVSFSEQCISAVKFEMQTSVARDKSTILRYVWTVGHFKKGTTYTFKVPKTWLEEL